MFRVSCPHCQAPLQVENRLLGQKVTCGKCQQTIVLATPAGATTQTAAQRNEQRLRRPARKKILAAAVLAAILLLMLGSAVGLVLTLRHHQSTPLAQEPAASERLAETNEEQPPGAGRQPPSRPAAGELEGDSLLRVLDKAVKNLHAPTMNVFKRQQAQEQYLATLISYRDRGIRLALKVSSVNVLAVEVEGLTLDPDYGERNMTAAQRFLAGGPEPPKLPPVAYVSLDFSGTDFGTKTYKETLPPLFGYNAQSPPPRRDKVPSRNLIPSDRFDPHVLRELEKGQSLFVKGRIVSLIPYQQTLPVGGYDHMLLSLKTEQIISRQP
jgi:predicted Zn finger-like uncharacterized protein